ncbi:MAG TPA: ABC transporter ATP-binding protein [Candidatus Didemnitutus sp.]|nr:ABC transporter ATP-binding protein [Candidatus Didemnitutus sp.]
MNPGMWRGGGHAFQKDEEVLKHKLAPGTIRRVVQFGRKYAGILLFFLALVVLDAAVGTINPLIYRQLMNRGILAGRADLVLQLAALAAGVAIVDSALTFFQRRIASQVGLQIVFDLRTRVFVHIQQMSLAFFTRAKTGALVSRLNADVSGVRDAFTDILSTALGNLVTVIIVLAVMFSLSWELTSCILVLVPLFLFPARYIGRRLRVLTRENYDRLADMNSLMVERFNVAGAMVAKVFGRPDEERERFEQQARRVRDIGLSISNHARVLFIGLGLLASLGVAVVYGWGGFEAARHKLDPGTVIALVSYLIRLYGPLTALSSLQVDVMTTLVSFERVFEVLDLQPGVVEKPGAVQIRRGPVRIEFDRVGFRYPSASEVSLASLESVAAPAKHPDRDVLQEVSFVAEPGQMIALVGPSGAGKTTLAMLAARLYDPRSGAVRFNGVDLREATHESVRHAVGMVMQDSHLFHDTIRANLLYARPGATDAELMAALHDAQLDALVQGLPQGLDTVVGDRGHRLSGGEKQRLAIARLLLKAPALVILDEATAHLDSNSERAIQEAFENALKGRTSIVIAHRLSTVRHAHQILVLDRGRVVERGGHEELLQTGQLYAKLYRTQFAAEGAKGGRTEGLNG